MVKIRFDFTKKIPQIDLDKEKITRTDINLLQTVFYQMSLGKKFPQKFTLEVAGITVKITPIEKSLAKDIKKARDVFKNLSKDVALAYLDFV